MFDELRKFFFKPDEKDGKNNRQSVLMYLSFVVMLGILMILWSNRTVPTGQPVQQSVSGDESTPVFNTTSAPNSWETEMEQNMGQILALIDGVGRVKVEITLEKDREFQYGYNSSVTESETEEEDSSGGTRFIKDSSRTQDIVIVRDNNGNEQPVEISKLYPIVKGVLVVAEGAENPKTNAELTIAVQTVLQVDLHKICILPYKR